MSNSTQNDWEDKLKGALLLTREEPIEVIFSGGVSKTISVIPWSMFVIAMDKLLADARKEVMVYKSEVEMSRLLQQLEGMELISPKLRLDIEKVCIETNRATRADARKEEKEGIARWFETDLQGEFNGKQIAELIRLLTTQKEEQI